MIQGAAAELFKTWAVTVRARAVPLDARIVLCLHDELLVHVPAANAGATEELLHTCLQDAAARWQGGRSDVRFVADVSVVRRGAGARALEPIGRQPRCQGSEPQFEEDLVGRCRDLVGAGEGAVGTFPVSLPDRQFGLPRSAHAGCVVVGTEGFAQFAE